MRPVPIYATSSHQLDAARRMKAGLACHDVRAEIVQAVTGPHDFVICWSWHVGRTFREKGYDVLVMERGYIADRFHWTSLGWNGLNGRATFGNVHDDGRRWRMHFAQLMRPWRPEPAADAPILILGQVPTDAAVRLRHPFKYPAWIEETARLLQIHERPLVYRPHPEALKRGGDRPPWGTEIDKGPLAASLARCAWAVTLNSNSAVDAVLAGVPTVTVDHGAIAWDVTGHRREERPPQVDREAWARRLAWKQWLPSEIEDGTAWSVVREARPVKAAA